MGKWGRKLDEEEAKKKKLKANCERRSGESEFVRIVFAEEKKNFFFNLSAVGNSEEKGKREKKFPLYIILIIQTGYYT